MKPYFADPRNPSRHASKPLLPCLETPGDKIWDQNSDRFLQYANVPVREKAKHNSFAAVGYAVNYNEWSKELRCINSKPNYSAQNKKLKHSLQVGAGGFY